MTTAHSEPGDNGGLCESCNDPKTLHETQHKYPVLLGGGIGWGTMWLCPKCLKEHEERDSARREATPVGATAPPAEQRNAEEKRMDTINEFLVGANGAGVVVMNPPRGLISKEQAIRLAAYLIALSGATDEEVDAMRNAVEST